MTLMTLIPTYLKDSTSDVIEKLIEVIIVEFEYLNIHKHVLRAELELWKSRWVDKDWYLNLIYND